MEKNEYLTRDKFLECNWGSEIPENERYDYLTISRILEVSARNVLDLGKTDEYKILELLYKVTSMLLEPNSLNEPFKPAFLDLQNQRRGVIPDDFTLNELTFFELILGDVDEPALKARLADILWLMKSPRNPDYARMAIDSYTSASINEEGWHRGVNTCWSRAIQLSMQIKDYASLDDIKGRLFAAFSVEYSNLKYMNFWIADLMDKFKVDKDFEKNIADSLFTRASNFKTQYDYFTARSYFELAAKKYKKCGLEDEWTNSLVEIAETFELEADSRRKDSNLVANSCYENAIQAYRNIPSKHRYKHNVEEKISNIRTKKFSSGQASIDEMVKFETEKYNIVELVESSITHVTGKRNAQQALLYFCGLSQGANYQMLRDNAKELLNNSLFDSIFGKFKMSSDGRVIARIPSLKREVSLDDPENEFLLKSKMYECFCNQVQVIVQANILPALRQLSLEHRFTRELLIAICEKSPLIPEGRATLTGSALWLGFEEDFSTAIHLLCPQLENIVRTELTKVGAQTRNIDKVGIENENGLSTLMNLPEVENIFGKDLVFEIKCIFTESLGFNLRNQVAHGLLDDETSSTIATVYAWWMMLRIIINSLINR
ncbi:DUF4209 domain-containing protein [Acinetobacter baumannii]|nr:DUF4209 domain-containing protein [Acinetobacter baumannii]MDO7329800.1 DUF4209 domain-containing protein [Acinetobacter baumannii]